MSPVAQKFFKASLIYLTLGLVVQAVAVFDVWLGFNPLAYTAITATQQILLLGWLTQLGLALVYDHWLCPLQPKTMPTANTIHPISHIPERSLPLGHPKSSGLVFILFNIGLSLVIVGQPGLALFGGSWLGALAALGGLLQFVAGMIFVREAWHMLRSR